MLGIYTSYRCASCKNEFVLLSEDIRKMTRDRYLVCPYCNSKRIAVGKVTDSLRECMQESSYRRYKGAITQRR